MYDYIKGPLAATAEGYAVVDACGVGYRIFTSTRSLKNAGGTGEIVTFYTYLHIREDVFDLYGFTTTQERKTFEMLLSVSGVGPKAALSILSSLSPESLALALVTGDAKAITMAQGVGPKLAQRIILELKDKIKTEDLKKSSSASSAPLPIGGIENEAVEALVVLGYSPAAAVRAVESAGEGLPLEETIRRALKSLL